MMLIKCSMKGPTRALSIILLVDWIIGGYSCVATHGVTGHSMRCSGQDNVRELFEMIPVRDVVSLNTMIAGNVHRGMRKEALEMVKQMGTAKARPDFVALSSILPIFAEHVDVRKGKEIHNCAVSHGYDTDIFIGSSFHMIKAGAKPVPVFSSTLPTCAYLTTLHWGTQLHGYITTVGFDDNEPVASSLVNMYAKFGKIKAEWWIFNNMKVLDTVIPMSESYPYRIYWFSAPYTGPDRSTVRKFGLGSARPVRTISKLEDFRAKFIERPEDNIRVYYRFPARVIRERTERVKIDRIVSRLKDIHLQNNLHATDTPQLITARKISEVQLQQTLSCDVDIIFSTNEIYQEMGSKAFMTCKQGCKLEMWNKKNMHLGACRCTEIISCEDKRYTVRHGWINVLEAVSPKDVTLALLWLILIIYREPFWVRQ